MRIVNSQTKIIATLGPASISNVNFALDQVVDWIALSFVRKASDIFDPLSLIKKKKLIQGLMWIPVHLDWRLNERHYYLGDATHIEQTVRAVASQTLLKH